jgi:hypothetical protein
MKLKQFMNAAVILFGTLSFLSLILLFGVLSDIWHDFASPEVWARAGMDLPAWYSPEVNQCPGEWRALQICFLIIIAFHILLFARWLASRSGAKEKANFMMEL